MSVVRAQVVFPKLSGIAADASVNTLYFNTSATPDTTELDAIQDLLESFYGEDTSTGGTQIANYMSNLINDANIRVRYYNMASPEPRVPLREDLLAINVGTDDPLPEEIALCLSFHAPFTSGEPKARRRGRIFLGPLAKNIVGSTANANRPYADAIPVFTTAMERLRDDSAAAAVPWCVWSQTDGAGFNVSAGWVDNAFDVQRRRGVAPTQRHVWS